MRRRCKRHDFHEILCDKCDPKALTRLEKLFRKRAIAAGKDAERHQQGSFWRGMSNGEAMAYADAMWMVQKALGAR